MPVLITVGNCFIHALRTLLCKGFQCAALKGESWWNLLRMRLARSTFQGLVLSDDGKRSEVTDGIWEAMGTGTLVTDKE
jgi:hypothetical protein